VNKSILTKEVPSATTKYFPFGAMAMELKLQNELCDGDEANVVPLLHSLFCPAKVHAFVILSNALHQPLQPSPPNLLPSSHTSPSSNMPFPHSGKSLGERFINCVIVFGGQIIASSVVENINNNIKIITFIF
jgi:hypothetical protein